MRWWGPSDGAGIALGIVFLVLHVIAGAIWVVASLFAISLRDCGFFESNCTEPALEQEVRDWLGVATGGLFWLGVASLLLLSCFRRVPRWLPPVAPFVWAAIATGVVVLLSFA